MTVQEFIIKQEIIHRQYPMNWSELRMWLEDFSDAIKEETKNENKESTDTAFGNDYMCGEMDQREWWINRINNEVKRWIDSENHSIGDLFTKLLPNTEPTYEESKEAFFEMSKQTMSNFILKEMKETIIDDEDQNRYSEEELERNLVIKVPSKLSHSVTLVPDLNKWFEEELERRMPNEESIIGAKFGNNTFLKGMEWLKLELLKTNKTL